MAACMEPGRGGCMQGMHLWRVIQMVRAATAAPVPSTAASTMPATLAGGRFSLSCSMATSCDFAVPTSPAALTALITT